MMAGVNVSALVVGILSIIEGCSATINDTLLMAVDGRKAESVAIGKRGTRTRTAPLIDLAAPFRNFTCIGGGMASGSIGQYPGAPDYIANTFVFDVSVSQLIRPGYGGANVSGGAYFKSWVGFEAGTPTQGGGGRTGDVSNVTFTNMTVDDTTRAVYINKCYDKVALQANYCDTSTLVFEDLSIWNVKGIVQSDIDISLNFSAAAPCHDISFDSVELTVSGTHLTAAVTCDDAENVEAVVCTYG